MAPTLAPVHTSVSWLPGCNTSTLRSSTSPLPVVDPSRNDALGRSALSYIDNSGCAVELAEMLTRSNTHAWPAGTLGMEMMAVPVASALALAMNGGWRHRPAPRGRRGRGG